MQSDRVLGNQKEREEHFTGMGQTGKIKVRQS